MAGTKSYFGFRTDQSQRGQEIIEFGLVLVVFMILTFGIVEAGRLMWTYTAVASGAREGTRFAMVHGADSLSPATASDVEEAVRNHTLGLNVEVTTVWDDPDKEPGTKVQVQVQSVFRSIVPYFIGIATIPLSSTSRAVIDF